MNFDEVSGTYLIDSVFLDNLVLDPSPLYRCDDAQLVPEQSGGCRVVDSSSGELVHELGLRDKDVLLSLNQHPVHSGLDLLIAFNKLRSHGATTFDLALHRKGRPLTLRYQLVKP